MARQPSLETRKLIVFVATIVSALVAILFMNRTLAPAGTVSSSGDNPVLLHALERMYANPDTLSMTMQPGPRAERLLRRTEMPLLHDADVLVLGQSDADHMSSTFFRDGARFHNGFLSNSIFAYHFEVFEEFVRAHGLPSLILYDVRSGYLLVEGKEPAYDSAPAVFELWDGALYAQGNAASHWYTGLDSMLSLQQTEESVRILGAKFRARGRVDPGDADDGAPFHVVPRDRASKSYRWLADGSRVYPGEVDAVLAPRTQKRVEEATGDRRINQARVEMLGRYLDRYRAAGATLIVYTPPVSPRILTDEPRQIGILEALDAPVRAVVEQRGYDYCDLSTQTLAIGCTAADFYDETHLSRGCNRRIVGQLVAGCAKTRGSLLGAKVVPEVAAGHR